MPRITAISISVCLFAVVLASNARADLILTIGGNAGSSVITYQASGSVTVANTSSGLSSAIAIAPGVGGGYTSAFDNNLGDFLRTGASGSLNDDLVLVGGGVSFRRNGVQFGVLDTIDFDPSDGAGGDDVELDPTVTIVYPNLTPGDVLSWTGNGTIVLDGGETFDSLFTPGTFTNAIDGGFYRVNIVANAVPEPNSILMIGFIGLAVALRRKRHAV